MKVQFTRRASASLLAMFLLLGASGACSKKEGDGKKAAAQPQVMIVVFASKAKIIRNGKEIPARVGFMVRAGDVIKTTQGTLDLQTRSGSAIRIKQFTTVSVTALVDANTRLRLRRGEMLAKVKRSSKSEKFNVVTPTAIAGVRGTTFSVNYSDDAAPPVIKVMEGRVAMSPRVKALEKFTREDIEKTPALKKLAAIEKEEIIIEKETSGTLDANLEKKVKSANKALEGIGKDKTGAVKLDKKVEKIADSIEKEKKPKLVLKKEKVTDADRADINTMITVDRKLFDALTKKSAGTSKTADAAARNEAIKKISVQRKEQLEKVLKVIESQASKNTFKTKAEIKKHYNRFERLVLKNGKVIEGAVIAQTSTVLIIHTKEGVKRVKKDNVDYQDFSVQ